MKYHSSAASVSHPTSYHVLLIEDDYIDQESVCRILALAEQDFTVKVCARLADGLRALRETEFDALLLDLNLPDSMGRETIRQIAEEFPKLPIIVLTGLEPIWLPHLPESQKVEYYFVKGEVTGAAITETIQTVTRKLSGAEEYFSQMGRDR